jgi:hypothetical protein
MNRELEKVTDLTYVKEIIRKYDLTLYDESVDNEKIIELFEHDIIEESNDDKYLYYVGLYYGKKMKNYDLMEKHYLMVIEKSNNYHAIFELVNYYNKIKNYVLLKKYLSLLINKFNSISHQNINEFYSEYWCTYQFYVRDNICPFDGRNINSLIEYFNKKILTDDDAVYIIEHELHGVYIDIKIILSNKLIDYCYNCSSLEEYLDIELYISVINLVYCD